MKTSDKALIVKEAKVWQSPQEHFVTNFVSSEGWFISLNWSGIKKEYSHV